MEFKIYSSSFKDDEMIPRKYCCDGINISPPLNWNDPPVNTKSFALLNDDPDAPVGDWVHWIVYNIPKEAKELKEEASSKKILPIGSLEGKNGWGKIGYGGPCPPSGTHQYFFKLYALDILLNAREGISKKQLLSLMNGHILAQAELIGKYNRGR